MVAGPRQAGKTTLVRQVLDRLEGQWHYASADEPMLRDSAWLRAQWERARLLARDAGVDGAVFAIDEVQKIVGWSETVKRLWDEDTAADLSLQVVILGSAPLLVHGGLVESLTGRFEQIRLPHWSFVEMQEAFSLSLDQFLYFGAYPGAASLIGDPGGALSAAQEAVSSIQIQSTDTSFDETTGVARASGDVEVNYGTTTIFADTAEYHQSTGDVFARGNVTIYKDGGVFSGEEIIYNIETGEMTATELRSALAPIFYETGQVEVPSDTQQMLELKQSLFTTHDQKDPNYKIKAKTVRIYPGDKVVFKSATVYAGGVPILWLPYLSQPLDDELGYFFTPG